MTLISQNLPSHTHRAASTNAATLGDPGDNVTGNTGTTLLYGAGSDVSMSSAMQLTGGNGSHNNMMPFLGIHFIIALFGVYPSRT